MRFYLYNLGKKLFYADCYSQRLTWYQRAYLWIWSRVVGRGGA